MKIMKNNLFFISIILMIIYFFSAVSVADVNSTCDDLEIIEDGSLDLSCVNDACDNSSGYNGNFNCVNSVCDNVGAVSDDYNDLSADEECLGAIEVHSPKLPHIDIYCPIYSKCDDFNDLQKMIYDHGEVT